MGCFEGFTGLPSVGGVVPQTLPDTASEASRFASTLPTVLVDLVVCGMFSRSLTPVGRGQGCVHQVWVELFVVGV